MIMHLYLIYHLLVILGAAHGHHVGDGELKERGDVPLGHLVVSSWHRRDFEVGLS